MVIFHSYVSLAEGNLWFHMVFPCFFDGFSYGPPPPTPRYWAKKPPAPRRAGGTSSLKRERTSTCFGGLSGISWDLKRIYQLNWWFYGISTQKNGDKKGRSPRNMLNFMIIRGFLVEPWEIEDSTRRNGFLKMLISWAAGNIIMLIPGRGVIKHGWEIPWKWRTCGGANGKPRLENGLQIAASIHMYVCLRMLREGMYIYIYMYYIYIYI